MEIIKDVAFDAGRLLRMTKLHEIPLERFKETNRDFLNLLKKSGISPEHQRLPHLLCWGAALTSAGLGAIEVCRGKVLPRIQHAMPATLVATGTLLLSSQLLDSDLALADISEKAGVIVYSVYKGFNNERSDENE